MLYPYPYEPVIAFLAALPLAAMVIVMRKPGVYEIEGRQNDARASMVIPVMLPGLVLALRAIFDLQFVTEAPILLWGGILGCVAALLLIRSAARSRHRILMTITLPAVLATYACAAIAFADTLFDKGDPEPHPVQVQAKRVDRARNTRHYLTVDSWNDSSASTEVKVVSELYREVNAGDLICIYVYPGALRIPWTAVDRCAE